MRVHYCKHTTVMTCPQLVRHAIDGREKEMGVGVTITAANVTPTPIIVEMAGIEPASNSRHHVLLRAQSTQRFPQPPASAQTR